MHVSYGQLKLPLKFYFCPCIQNCMHWHFKCGKCQVISLLNNFQLLLFKMWAKHRFIPKIMPIRIRIEIAESHVDFDRVENNCSSTNDGNDILYFCLFTAYNWMQNCNVDSIGLLVHNMPSEVWLKIEIRICFEKCKAQDEVLSSWPRIFVLPM